MMAVKHLLNSEQYWKNRAEEREAEWTKKSKAEIEKEVKNLYARALINIKKDINDLYERFADENGLSITDAKKLITRNEFTVWRMDIEDYVQKSELDNKLLKELNTLAMKSRISRLDKLYGEILLELTKMADGYDDKLNDYLKTALADNYYHTTFDICKGLNILLPVSTLDTETVEDIIRTPWSGKQFSKRIWNNTDTLAKVLKQEISNAMIRGVNSREMAQIISKKMDSSYKQAVTLVRSELNYVNNQSSLKSIKDAGGQKYRFIATLDSRTSMICRQMDGIVCEVDKGVPGTNMPPMHPRCRSTIAITNLSSSSARKRISRVNGEIKYVPANMKYVDWEKIYVKKTMTLAEWEKANKQPKAKKNDIIKSRKTNSTIEEKMNSYRLEYLKSAAKNKPFSEREVIIKKAGRELIDVLDINSIQKKFAELEAIKTKLKYYYDEYNKKPSKKLLDEWIACRNELKKEQTEYYYFSSSEVKNILSRFRAMGSNDLDLKAHFKNSKSKKLSNMLKAYNVYPTDWIKRSIDKSTISIKSVKRGYYNGRDNIIALSGDDEGEIFETAIHELGHRMEDVITAILKHEQEFYNCRTANEDLQWLGKGYRRTEKTRKDDFLDVYMGKDYGGKAYELASMGFQLVYTNPVELLKDKDMAEWIFGMLVLL